MKNKFRIVILTALSALPAHAQSNSQLWSQFADSQIANFDFVAPVVKDDTVPPKQAGSIFFNAASGEFQGFDLSGATVKLSTASENWTSYTPTFTGLGTVSNNVAYYREVGDEVCVRGTVTAGTLTSSAVSITLPNGRTVDSSKAAASAAAGGKRMGWMLQAANVIFSTNSNAIFYDGSTNNLVYVTNVANPSYSKPTGAALFVNNGWLDYDFRFPY